MVSHNQVCYKSLKKTGSGLSFCLSEVLSERQMQNLITVEDICDLKEKKVPFVMILGKELLALKVWSSILSAVTLSHQKSMSFCHFSVLSQEVN